MGSLPQHLFPLTTISLFLSAVGMVFAGLSLNVSPVIWIVPSVIIFTFAHHTYILLLGSSEKQSDLRIYSSAPIVCGYILAFLWSAALAVSVTLACLLLSGIMKSTDDGGKVKIWMPIIGGISLVEVIIVLYISVRSHQEMKRIRYRNKWRWRLDLTGRNETPWRSVFIAPVLLWNNKYSL